MGDLTVNPANTSHIFVAGETYSGGASRISLFKSSNGGTSWTTSIVSSAAGGVGQAVAINPLNEQVIYVGGQASPQALLYVSTNGGSSWTQLAAGVFGTYANIRAIAVDPVQPSRIFVGASSGLYRSENSGASWTKTGNFAVSGIRINKNAANEIWASASSSGMSFSNNRGASWTAINDGLEVLQVNGLDWSPAVGMVYAATTSGGVFRRSTSSQAFLTISATSGGTTTPAPGTYAHSLGTVVTVTATPVAHYRFIGWTGDATGTANPLSLTMTGNKSVTAKFQRIIYPPANFTGIKKVNRGVLVSEYINVLKWEAHPNNVNIIKYRLYLQSGTTFQLLAEFDPATLEYRHKGVSKDGAYTYMIRAVNNEPREGDSATITIR